MEKKLQEKASLLDRFLDTVERVCRSFFFFFLTGVQ